MDNPLSEPLNLKDLDREGLRQELAARGLKSYRGDQLFRWIWRRGAEDVEVMTDLSLELRKRLQREAVIPRLESCEEHVARDGTTKLLIALHDGRRVESVLIPDAERRTLCVSTQVGCAMGCTFCRTATMGLLRNLRPWEIVEQVAVVERMLKARGDQRSFQVGRGEAGKVERRLTHLVFMGMGEPLHNFEATVRACAILTDATGLAFPPSRITVSTVGLADRIEDFIQQTGVNLAISLNAATNGVRSQIMPINRRFEIGDLLEVVKRLPLAGRRRVTFEYVLLGGLTDSAEQARELTRLLQGLSERVKINLIPFNPHEGADYRRPSGETVASFRDALQSGSDLRVMIRRPRGDDILAACGQLALKAKPSA